MKQGSKNDVAFLLFTKDRATLYFYSVTYDRTNGNAALVQRLTRNLRQPNSVPQHGILVERFPGLQYGQTFDTAASGNVFCGDFDGDGNIEVAAAYLEPRNSNYL